MTLSPSSSDPLSGVLDDLRRLDGRALTGRLLESLLLHGIEATASALALPVLARLTAPGTADADRREQTHAWTRAVLAALDEVRVPAIGPGPGTVLLAALPRQFLDLHLALLAAVLESRRWRAVVVGPDTPVRALELLPGILSPTAVVVAGQDAVAMRGHRRALSRLGRTHPLHLLLVDGGHSTRVSGVPVLPSGLGAAADRLDEAARTARPPAAPSIAG